MDKKKSVYPYHGAPIIQLKANRATEIKVMVAIATIGFSRAISHGAVSADFACYRFFTPALMTILRRTVMDDSLIETVNLGTDLEYIERLIPHCMKESATEIERRSLQHIAEENHECHAEQWLRVYCHTDSVTDEMNSQKADPPGDHENQAAVGIGAESREEVLALLDIIAVGAHHAVANHALPINYFKNRLSFQSGFFRFLSSLGVPPELQKALKWLSNPDDINQAGLPRENLSATASEMELLNILKINPPFRNPPDQWFFMPFGRNISRYQLYIY